MRTFRLIGTTLLMVLCAVNFTACSDDEDENNDTNSGINPQKVFINGMPKQVSDMKITQDASGLVSKIETDDAVAIFKYPTAVTTRAELPNQLVIVELTEDTGGQYEETFIFKMEIGSNGFIKHCDETEEDGDLETWDFAYSAEGNLVSMNRSEGGSETTTITYKDGDIIKTSTVSADSPEDVVIHTIDYISNTVTTPIENKGCLMFYDEIFGIDMDEMWFAYYAGLLGKATKHLPVKDYYIANFANYEDYEDVIRFTWELNTNGFPISLSVLSEKGYSENCSIVW
jgi:YD repeat-containing protein